MKLTPGTLFTAALLCALLGLPTFGPSADAAIATVAAAVDGDGDGDDDDGDDDDGDDDDGDDDDGDDDDGDDDDGDDDDGDDDDGDDDDGDDDDGDDDDGDDDDGDDDDGDDDDGDDDDGDDDDGDDDDGDDGDDCDDAEDGGEPDPCVTTFCVGDGTGNGGPPCPCGNDSPAGSGAGCLNGTGTGGLLTASGVPSVSDDTLVLTSVTPMNAPGYFVMGSAEGSQEPFGNGLRCVGGAVVRLAKIPGGTGTNNMYPIPGDPSISDEFGLVPGDVRYFMVWYRDPMGLCGFTFNTTNGVRVRWGP